MSEILDALEEAANNPNSGKTRISPFLPSKLVRQLKAKAKEEGKPYNLVLQDILEKEFSENSLEKRVNKLEKSMLRMKSRERMLFGNSDKKKSTQRRSNKKKATKKLVKKAV